MEKIVPFPRTGPDDENREAKAYDWFARLDNGDLSPEDLAEFDDWLARNPQHRVDMSHIAQVWRELDILDELTVGRDQATRAGKNHKRYTRGRFFQLLPSPRLGIALAFVLVLIVAATAFFRFQGHAPMDAGKIYATGVGEQQSVALADGSTVLLNTDSRVQVNYDTKHYRTLHLLQGEAHFTVAHDPGRPFLVYAGTGIVRAVGTAFTVRLWEHDMEVTVTEGAVELVPEPEPAPEDTGNDPHRPPESLPATEPAAQLAVVTAGHRATFDRDIESIDAMSAEQLARKLSWHQGMLSFSGDPLEVVVEEVSRYTRIKIVIVDPALRELRIGGYFRIGETDDIFEALESTFNVRVERISGKLVYLSAGQGQHMPGTASGTRL